MTPQHRAISPGIVVSIVFTLCACLGSFAQPPAVIGPLSADDAVIYALQHNPQVVHGLQDLRSRRCKSTWRAPMACPLPA